MSGDSFSQVVVCDFEYEVADGDLPDVLCMCAYVLNQNLQLVRKIQLWRGEFGPTPPFDIGPDTLFVAYSAWAEMTCFMTLGWNFPVHIFDQHTAYLAATNILLPHNPEEKRTREHKGLPDACRRYDIPGWQNIDKEDIAKAIGEGRWHEYGRERCEEYCEEDIRVSTLLLRKQLAPWGRLPSGNVPHILHWSNYSAKAVARIQAVGMPIDMRLWNLVQENKAAVIDALLRQFDPSYGDDEPIYTPEGEWSGRRFEQWLLRNGVRQWPRLESGALDLEGDTFQMMSHLPGIENLHALRDSLRVIVGAKLPIGRDGRNRPKLFPFCTATGRNAHAASLYNCHAGLRSFMVFPKNKIGVYLDWSSQEVGVAAARSGDEQLKADYLSDIYYHLAKLCGWTDDPDHVRWKNNNPDVRNRCKPIQLGINYGMSVRTLSRSLDRHALIGSEILDRHKQRYPCFHQWRTEYVQNAMVTRKVETTLGWPLRLSTSPNQRTLYNFPMQGDGAEMLRLAAVRLCDAGLVPSMLIHDGILLELENESQVQQAIEIMKVAGREICDGLEIGVGIDQKLVGGARYRDKRPKAKEMWLSIIDVLRGLGIEDAAA